MMKTRKFTVGMATYNDFNGVWMTVQSHRIYNSDRIAEIIVVDNNPGSEQGRMIKNFCNIAGNVRYVEFPNPKGPALAKEQVFRNSQTEYTVCTDAHVMLFPGALDSLARFYDVYPDSGDLVHGPLVMTTCLRLVRTLMIFGL